MKNVLIILSILLIIFFALVLYQKSNTTGEKGIYFFYENQEIFVSFIELRSFPQITFITKRGDKYTGYNLKKILISLNIIINYKSDITFSSNDGGNLTINMSAKDNLYLVFTEDGHGQFVRLVIPSDEFSQRWIKYIKTIEIK